MWFVFRPTDDAVRSFLRAASELGFSYPEVGDSRGRFPAGYQHDFNRVQLGQGEKLFAAACDGLCRWQMFPKPWTQIVPADAPIAEGTMVAVVARAMGLWWLN